MPNNLKMVLLQTADFNITNLQNFALTPSNLDTALPLLSRLTDTLLSFVPLTLNMTKPVKMHHPPQE